MIYIIILLFLLTIRRIVVKKEKFINHVKGANKIEQRRKIRLGGTTQWIYIRGSHKNNEVILFLHGGPGLPQSAMMKRKYQMMLERNYVVVHWDQRGACKSWYPSAKQGPLTRPKIVEDLVLLSEFLCNRFKVSKIILMGHAWGTCLAVEAIKKRPELFSAYVGIAQFVNGLKQETHSYEYCLEQAKENQKKSVYNKLSQIGPPPFKNPYLDTLYQRKWLIKFGGFSRPGFSLLKLAYETYLCPYYSAYDVYIKYPKGFYYSVRELWKKELYALDYEETHREFSIPILLCSGRHDKVIPTHLVQEYFETVKTSHKEFVVFENSGHLPNFEEPNAFNKVVVEFLNKWV